ncbi:hypothetical protein ACK8P5_16580 [Paenibacillus sp. EC2-1]|uniref:hypothetical protein n=1 Tax=Paenibacillus sp. EC2-1 TaxID=3388665 RepID=UPI003BEEDBAE
MHNDFLVSILIKALSVYCNKSIKEVTSVFNLSIVDSETSGQKAIELTLVERNLELPSGFFEQVLENGKFPVAPTTENPSTELCM